MRRSAVQLLFFVLFAGLFFLGEAVSGFPPALFLRFDPLLALTQLLATRSLHVNMLISLTVLLSAVLAGRIFCGYVCPLGALFDFFSLRRRRGKPDRRAFHMPKYCLLTGIAAAAVLGLNLAGTVDPLSFLTRAFSLLVYPVAVFAANAGLDAARPIAEHYSLYALARTVYRQPVFFMFEITLAASLILFSLNLFYPRIWCRSLCPLGALLGLFSRTRLLRRRVSDRCISCMKCIEACPPGAIAPDDPYATNKSECIFCNACSQICPAAAISFPLTLFRHDAKEFAVNVGRRSMLVSAAAGLFAAAGGSYASYIFPRRQAHLIRPPGAVPEQLFLNRCVRCGQCMKVCPTNTLQPCRLESGVKGIWTPQLATRHAGCDQQCMLCGQACPTGAIRALPLEEKKHAKIGTAVIDRERCLVWKEDRLCLICDEQCPYNAIVFRWEKGFRRPFVVEHKCNGCGFCEEQCPVDGESAIRVTAKDEMRLAAGSYKARAKELALDFTESAGDDRFLPPASEDNQTLPEGFDVE